MRRYLGKVIGSTFCFERTKKEYFHKNFGAFGVCYFFLNHPELGVKLFYLKKGLVRKREFINGVISAERARAFRNQPWERGDAKRGFERTPMMAYAGFEPQFFVREGGIGGR